MVRELRTWWPERWALTSDLDADLLISRLQIVWHHSGLHVEEFSLPALDLKLLVDSLHAMTGKACETDGWEVDLIQSLPLCHLDRLLQFFSFGGRFWFVAAAAAALES